jgi:DMSO/TMAO reductase YedYZ molybdopterin-dependent catalytic subunit
VSTQLRRQLLAALIGLLAAGVAIGVGELVAALLRPAASPVIAVGNRFILLTPESVKRTAIRQFGTNDKAALQAGIYLVLLALAVLIGLVALRSLRLGLVGVALLGAIGGYAALTANAHRGSDVVPSVAGALAGMVALALLVRAATGSRATPGDQSSGNQTALGNRQRPYRPGALLADRRGFLRGGLASAGLAVLGGFGGRALQRRRYDASAARAAVQLPPPVSGPLGLPGASSGAAGAADGGTNFDLGKSGLPFQTPADRFYRIDTALSVPQLDPNTWKLRIHGMVQRPITLSFADLLARPLVERWVTLTCVSNEVGGDLVSNARFRGVLLADLLREAGISAGASQLLATSSDGMTIGSPTEVVMDGRDAMLAVGMNGEPLPTEHGFPVRMVVPGLYGYVSACKWIVDLEATTFEAYQAYWVKGGWAARGPIKLASRIDRPGPSETVGVGASVPVAGVAWDQHVGVSKVEVQVDAGPWQQAVLAPVPSTDTWRQWVYLWTPPSPGRHTLRVRAFDANGRPQDESATDPFPAGATGLHSVTVRAS